jgi:hypothetical protein
MPGSFPVASKILHKYEQDRAYRLHRQKVHNRSIYFQALHNLYHIGLCIVYISYIIHILYIVRILYIMPTYIYIYYWVEIKLYKKYSWNQ